MDPTLRENFFFHSFLLNIFSSSYKNNIDQITDVFDLIPYSCVLGNTNYLVGQIIEFRQSGTHWKKITIFFF